jgi:predicted ATPase
MGMDNYYILTGGPGSGKTSLLEALAEAGYQTVPEVARAIIQEQYAIGGNATHEGDCHKFLELMFLRSVKVYQVGYDANRAVFFDRGIPELIGYCYLSKMAVPDYLKNAMPQYCYNKQVFILPPWQEIYKTDTERKQDFTEAQQTFECIKTAYIEAGYQLIEVPKLGVAQRMQFVLNYLGMPLP